VPQLGTGHRLGGQHIQANHLNAARLINESDAGRAAYFKEFYGVDEELPTHYDLVVNTDVLGAEQAAEIVVYAAKLA